LSPPALEEQTAAGRQARSGRTADRAIARAGSTTRAKRGAGSRGCGSAILPHTETGATCCRLDFDSAGSLRGAATEPVSPSRAEEALVPSRPPGPAPAREAAVERQPAVAAFVVGEPAEDARLHRTAPATLRHCGGVAGAESVLAHRAYQLRYSARVHGPYASDFVMAHAALRSSGASASVGTPTALSLRARPRRHRDRGSAAPPRRRASTRS
jgi:hypothetical protein